MSEAMPGKSTKTIETKQQKDSKKAKPDRREISPDALKNLRKVVIAQFSEGLYHEVGIRDICKQAKVSAQTVYKYFGNKEELLYACVREDLEAMNQRAIEAIDKGASFEDKLRGFKNEFFGFYEKNPAIAKIVFLNIPPLYWMSNQAFMQHDLHDGLRVLIQEGQKNKTLANSIPDDLLLEVSIGAAHRLIILWLSRGQDSLMELAEHFVASLVHQVNPQ